MIRPLVYLIIILVLASCTASKQIQSLKPGASYSKETVYEKQVSYLQLPVELGVADVQSQTNKYLSGLIYEDGNLSDDNLEIKVWKQGNILITESDGKLQLELPLKIWSRIRYGVDKMGISAHDIREVNLNGIVKLNTAVTFESWRLRTETQVENIEWKESPTIAVMGKNVPITYLINPAISLFKDKMSKLIDESIEKSFDIKSYVVAALEALSKPVQVNEEYNAWFGIQPLVLYSTKASIANKKITVNLGMKAYVESSVGSKPTLAFDKSKLSMLAVDKMPTGFGVNVAGFITYQNAAALMRKNFTGQKFESGKKSVTITQVNLWGKDGKMIIEMGMKGFVNGIFYLSGIPKYNAAKKEIFLEEVSFVLDSKNQLLKAGDWLAHGLITKKIAENCRFSIAEQLKEGEKSMISYLSNYQPVKGVKVNGTLTQLAPNKIFLTENAVIAMIVAKGSVRINVSGI